MRSILQDFLSIHPEGISHSIPFLQKSPSDTRSTFDIHSTTTQALSSIFDAGREQVIQKILVPNKAEYRRHMDINTQKVLPFGSKTQKNRACNQYYPSNIRIYSAEIEESSFPTQKQNFLKRIGATSKSERFTQSEEYAFTYRLLTTSILVRELQLYPWRYESAYPKEYLQDRMMLCFGKVYLASAVLKQLNIPYLVYAMDHHANLVVLF